MEKGTNRELDCKNCTQNATIHTNDFYAKNSKLISIISGAIFFGGTLVGLYIVFEMIREMKTIMGISVVACGLLIPVWIYTILNKVDGNRVRDFNQSYVSE